MFYITVDLLVAELVNAALASSHNHIETTERPSMTATWACETAVLYLRTQRRGCLETAGGPAIWNRLVPLTHVVVDNPEGCLHCKAHHLEEQGVPTRGSRSRGRGPHHLWL